MINYNLETYFEFIPQKNLFFTFPKKGVLNLKRGNTHGKKTSLFIDFLINNKT